MLELLAGYDSSSSSSLAVGAEAPRSPVHSSCNRHDTLLTRRSQDALRIDHPQGASAVGIGGHCSSNTACHDDGRASNESGSSTAKKQNPEIDVGVEINEEVSHTAKKRRTNPSSFVEVAKEQKCAASRVIIAGCNDKAKYYYELAAMGGSITARHNLGACEKDAGNMDRAVKHWMIAAGAGCDKSLKAIRVCYLDGDATKDDFEKALRAHKEAKDEMKSEQREAAAAQYVRS